MATTFGPLPVQSGPTLYTEAPQLQQQQAQQTTTGAPRAWLREDVLELVVEPLGLASVAAQVATFRTGLTGNALRVPMVTKDPSAAWVAEGEEIPLSEAELDEAEAPYRKVAGLSVVSRELASDTDPDAAQQIGEGLVRDIARKVDTAFFGSNATNAKAPAGLENVTGIVRAVEAATFTNLDLFVDARMRAAGLGSPITAFVMNSTEARTLATLKKNGSTNERLLNASPTEAGLLAVDGVPVLVSDAVPARVTWALPGARCTVAVREDVSVESDRSAFFTSDRVAIRAISRLAFAFSHPGAITRIERAAA